MLFRRPPGRVRPPRLQDGQRLEVMGRPVRLRVNGRARRISLRLDGARGEVVATAPSLARLPEALAFAQGRSDWIAERLDALPVRRPLVPGALIALGGEPLRLERAAMRIAPRICAAAGGEPARLLASGVGEAFARAALRALRAEALARLSVRTEAHCTRLDLAAPRLALQDARTRWGSCRKAGARGEAAAIRYSWRLVMAPPEVLDYVVAHECAHLVEAHHGAAFWALCRRLYGDVAPARAWLRLHGASLHAVG